MKIWRSFRLCIFRGNRMQRINFPVFFFLHIMYSFKVNSFFLLHFEFLNDLFFWSLVQMEDMVNYKAALLIFRRFVLLHRERNWLFFWCDVTDVACSKMRTLFHKISVSLLLHVITLFTPDSSPLWGCTERKTHCGNQVLRKQNLEGKKAQKNHEWTCRRAKSGKCMRAR